MPARSFAPGAFADDFRVVGMTISQQQSRQGVWIPNALTPPRAIRHRS
jgi:hypothetical protein